MSGTEDIKLLTDCGCCELPDIGHAGHFNRPGLDALAYRLATHSGFLERMLARLTRDQLPDNSGLDDLRPLAKLTTRDTTDPTIALLDAWAMVADVLAFYQERIANEGFLRTAGERRSVLELARTIGYELKPGVAASTVLAFTADGSKDSPPQVTVPRRTRVLSIPAKDQLPQTFETTEEIVARPEWNTLKPYTPELISTDPIERHVTSLRITGTATGLRAGDAILIVGQERIAHQGDEHWDFRTLESVNAVPGLGYTQINFKPGLGDQWPTTVGPAREHPRLYALRLRAALFGHNAPEWDSLDAGIRLRYAPQTLGAVNGVAFRPMSRGDDQGVSASADGTLRSWNVATGSPIAAFAGHRGAVNGVACTADGKLVVSCGDDGTVRLWDAATGGELGRYTGHKGPVLAVACGQYETTATIEKEKITTAHTVVVSGGTDTDLIVWDLIKGIALRTLSAHRGAVNSLALRVQDDTDPVVISGGDDGKVLVWNTVSGVHAEPFASFACAVVAVTAVQAGNELRVAAGGANGEIRRWSRATSGNWTTRSGFTTYANEAVASLAFTPAGDKLLCGAADGTLERWNWSDSQNTRIVAAHGGPITALAWSPNDATKILTGAGDHTLSVRNSALTETRKLAIKKAEDVNEWPGFDLLVNRQHPQIDLDNLYPVIVPDSWIVLARKGYAEVYRVTGTEVRWASGYSLSSKVTRLDLDGPEHLTWFGRRNTTVHAQSESLMPYIQRQPDRSPLHGRYIELATLVQGLEVGRWVVVGGQRMRARIEKASQLQLKSLDGYTTRDVAAGDLLVCLSPPYPDSLDYVVDEWLVHKDGFVPVVRPVPGSGAKSAKTISLRWQLRDRNGFEGYVSTTLDPMTDGSYRETQILALRPVDKNENLISEVAVIELVTETDRARSRLWFSAELDNLFDYEYLTINANVAAATHGETAEAEVLGSGDGTQANQRFNLRRSPLTYVSAATASGGESTLEVRVNNVLWKEVPTLHDLGPRDQRYLVRHDNQHLSTIVFGDGVRGTRLPTGQENIQATYRHGIGLEGEVAAGAVKLLVTKPLGIREVINPVAATGAAEPESLDEARRHAPVTVLTLDRIVSLKDYEDFAAAFAGIGKAQASALWTGTVQMAHITVATASGKPVERSSAVYANLLAALASLRDLSVPVRVQGFALLHFKLSAQLRVDPRYRRDQVEQSVRDALTWEFSFEQRAFGQAVTHAEVSTVIQSVPGVQAVTLTQFDFFVDAAPSSAATVRARASVGTDPSKLTPALLPSSRATWQSKPPGPRPAQLLLLYPTTDGVTLEEMPR